MPEVMNAMAKLRYTVNATEFVYIFRSGIHKATMNPASMIMTPITARAMPIDTFLFKKSSSSIIVVATKNYRFRLTTR